MRKKYSLTVQTTANTRRQAANQVQAIIRNWPVSHIDTLLEEASEASCGGEVSESE